ncbi:MAG TPA: hypothetical protein VND65_17740 [Candidatus Binatia bacterium]|nr:hypothetical protein [Candidatus Binatia bacterium]
MKRIAFALIATLLACSSVFAQKPTTYTFTDVTYPKDTFVQLLGVNDAGTIAGYHGATTNKGFTFVLPESFTAENFPQSLQTQVLAINSLTSPGTSGFYIDKNNVTHGFEHCAGVWITVDFPGSTFNQVLGINNNAQGAGYYQDSAGNFHPYIYNKVGGVFEELYLPNTTSAQATAINNAQTVVGFYLDSNQNAHGWELMNGSYITLNYPGAAQTMVTGINNSNEIVGTFFDQAGGTHGFTYIKGQWTQIDDPSGIGVTILNGVNDGGTLVGFLNISTAVNTGFVAMPSE